MKIAQRLLIGVFCAAILVIAWFVTITSESNIDKQRELIEEAEALVADEIYIRALPLLEEAVNIKTDETFDAEERLKLVYLSLGETRQYIDLLSRQLKRNDATPALFLEAAEYYIQQDRLKQLLETLKTGIEKTNDPELVSMYEKYRYAYTLESTVYEDVTAVANGAIQVKRGGLWGLASSSGKLGIPCEYEKISTFYDGRAIVLKNDEIYAVNQDNYRVNKMKNPAVIDFGNYGSLIFSLRTNNGWHLSYEDFIMGSEPFDEIGMFTYGYAAAKLNGKWGVINTSGQFVLPAEFDDIIKDELGRCYYQNAVFARKGNAVTLYVNDDNGFVAREGVYENAQPFTRDNYAAVQINNKWGFINTDGEMIIDCQFAEALSFSQHLAAVRQGDLWGYIGLNGEIVIESIFEQAKSFNDNSAPVRTTMGWQFITLVD